MLPRDEWVEPLARVYGLPPTSGTGRVPSWRSSRTRTRKRASRVLTALSGPAGPRRGKRAAGAAGS
jgi:hypothetical protein